MTNESTTEVVANALDLNAEQVAKAILLRNSLVILGALIAGILAYRAAKGFWFILLMVIVGSIAGNALAAGLNSLRNYK